MSTIIHIENLSKQYMLSQAGREKYTALRDVISKKASNLFRPGKQSGKEIFWALHNLNIDIEKGDRVGIVGRNGAGKSTLLKIISRITEPTTGKICISGRVASLLEVGTGFHPELTGRENIYLNGAILGMNRMEIRKKFDEIVSFAEIEKFLDTPVKRYSSGMYVRLAFSVAAHLEPEILLVDEVLAVGDVKFQKKCLGKMEEVSNNQGRTVLFVSHNMGVVSQLCNKGILLSHGEMKMMGDMKPVISQYLKSDDTQNHYRLTEPPAKPNYFTEIDVVNRQLESVTDFSFDEEILLRFSFHVGEEAMGLQLGIGLEDKFNTRVLTILKDIDFFRQPDGTYSGKVTMPSSIIAPNSYSFVFALWTKNGRIYDIVKGICPVTIHDNGTEFALYEGIDYGNIIIHPEWTSGQMFQHV